MTLLHRRAGMTGQTTPPAGEVDDRAAVYQAWAWPVIQRGELLQLSLEADVSAIAIPTSLSAGVTRILTDRHCAPAVLAHPFAPEHHLVLAGERFGARLPWSCGAYQVAGPLMLPPTMTIDGPVTWVTPPSGESLQLCREIDVFGALRSAAQQ